jgi:MFS family permease
MSSPLRKTSPSLLSLDWINFCVADVQMATAAFVAVYLSSARHWDPGRIGIVVAAQNIATMLAQPVAGAWIDRSDRKKFVVAAGSTVAAIACVAVLIAQTIPGQIATQIAIGLASAIFPPAIAALSLGLIGDEHLAARVARNEAFNHAGKVILALVAAALGTHLGYSWVFGLLAGFCAGAVFAAFRIRSRDIDNDAARAADHGKSASLRDLFADPRIPTFLLCIVLFHFGNAAMLQLAGQRLAAGRPESGSVYVSACILAAQSVMIPVALLAGKLAERIGRKPVFLAAYAAVVLRALLFAAVHSTYLLIAIQTLDGVSAALFGVVWTLINSDLAKGTGRFSLLQGFAAAAWYFGAFLSNLLAGLAAQRWGFEATFAGLALVAGCGFLLFLVRMPETTNTTVSPAIDAASPTSFEVESL